MPEPVSNEASATLDVDWQDSEAHTYHTSETGSSTVMFGTDLDDGGEQPPSSPHALATTVVVNESRPRPADRRINVARKTVPGYQGSKTVPGQGAKTIPGNHAGKGKGKTHVPFGAQRANKTQRAGLIFAVARIRGSLKRGRYAERITDTAAVYLTAVLEYLVAELLELSGNAARQLHRKRISPRHVSLAARNDEEFVRLIPASIIFPEGGFVPVPGFTQANAPLLRVETGAPRTKNR